MNASYHDKLQQTRQAIQNADVILVGGGAGLSASAGLHYDGERFTSHFADFIERYGLTDMYSSGFYEFPTPEEKWAYWSRHILMNRFNPGPSQVYRDLLEIIDSRPYFVITTNVDAQFYKACFLEDRIFAVQGDYGKIQCSQACHKTLYDNEGLVRQMVEEQCNCRIPSDLVPYCPRCGEPMDVNIRKDHYFVEDSNWREASGRYVQFITSLADKHIVLMELGVGYNTPTIIKMPFERITAAHENARLVRINMDAPEISPVNNTKTIAFSVDIHTVFNCL